MKKRICLLLAALLLTGCAEVPAEVQSGIDNYHSAGDVQNTHTGFVYIDTAEIGREFEKVVGRDYGQFHISDTIKAKAPAELHLVRFAKTEHFTEHYAEAMSLFFDESELSSRDIAKDEDGNMLFDDAEAKMFGCVSDDGFIAALQPDVYDISYSYDEPTVQIYHPTRNEDLSDTYELADGACSIRGAVDYVNDWLAHSYRPLAPQYAYEVEAVIVREHGEKYIFEILAHALYKNTAINSYTEEFDKGGAHPQLLKYTSCGIQIQMVRAEEIASFTNLCGILEPTEAEPVRQCISLQSALAYCAETFTDFQDVTVSDIQPTYTLEPEYVETEPDVFILTGYHSRPVWEIVMDAAPSEFLKSGEVNTCGDMRKYIYVDMLTGALSYNFEIVYRK